MNLTPEQLAYLKNLESPKKRRKFMLDCLVENVLGESVKFEEEINRLNVVYQKSTTTRTFEGLLNNKEIQHLESGDFDFNFSLVNALRECADKSNFTNEEVDMAKNLMTEREKFAENVKKIDEKKWTDEDMRKCFINGMMAEPKHSLNATFEHYFEGFKKRKNE